MGLSLPVLSCDGCGVCCLSVGPPPFMPGEEAALPPALREEFAAIVAAFPRPWHVHMDSLPPCSWFDPETKRCRNYEHRPRVCREFERGGPQCLADRAAATG